VLHIVMAQAQEKFEPAQQLVQAILSASSHDKTDQEKS
jgi:hypothetical protein